MNDENVPPALGAGQPAAALASLATNANSTNDATQPDDRSGGDALSQDLLNSLSDDEEVTPVPIPPPEQGVCGAGDKCRAPSTAILAMSQHRCANCHWEVHNKLWCGCFLGEVQQRFGFTPDVRCLQEAT